MSARPALTQARVKDWAAADGITVLCGRFEGVDQRVLDARGFEEVSVGDAVLAGGEAAAMVVIEACVRLIPGVLGQAESLSSESFEDGLLEHPQYTRPRTSRGSTSPRSCCRATTPRSPDGVRSRGKSPRGSGDRTSGSGISPNHS